jgi:imidazoleglycerol-phosphate dehydratase
MSGGTMPPADGVSTLVRQTGETRVRVRVALGDEGSAPRIATGEPFLDHMLVTLARYAGIGMDVAAEGDLRHHLVEDVAITLGLAFLEATPERCRRYGEAVVPMDDALVQAVVDVGGRFWYDGPLPSRLYEHFLRSLAENARWTLHVRALRGRDRHHVVEAAMKALGLALRTALRPGNAVFSTKGSVHLRREGE